jgi:hypothetical protein
MRVTPELRVKGFDPAGTVLDFWQWAFSDLCDDDIKGWFAEWLVAKLLKIPTTRRISWANSDLIIGNSAKNLRIEVKSTAYYQSWKLLDEFGESIIPKPLKSDARQTLRFSGLMAKTAIVPAKASDERLYKSDLYVFALQKHVDYQTWNALDLEQWEFFLATKEQLSGRRSITIRQLEDMGAGPLTAYEFSVRGREEITCRGFGEFTGSFLAERMADEAQYGREITFEELSEPKL